MIDAATRDFETWYEANFVAMVRLAYLMVGSVEAAHDLTQDAMVGVLRNWDRITDPQRYARRAVANACRSYHRRAAVMRRHPVPPQTPAELEAQEMSDALAKLSDRQRAAIVLRYWADMAEQDIAAVLDVRRGSVASLLHRGLAELRKEIEP